MRTPRGGGKSLNSIIHELYDNDETQVLTISNSANYGTDIVVSTAEDLASKWSFNKNTILIFYPGEYTSDYISTNDYDLTLIGIQQFENRPVLNVTDMNQQDFFIHCNNCYIDSIKVNVTQAVNFVHRTYGVFDCLGDNLTVNNCILTCENNESGSHVFIGRCGGIFQFSNTELYFKGSNLNAGFYLCDSAIFNCVNSIIKVELFETFQLIAGTFNGERNIIRSNSIYTDALNLGGNGKLFYFNNNIDFEVEFMHNNLTITDATLTEIAEFTKLTNSVFLFNSIAYAMDNVDVNCFGDEEEGKYYSDMNVVYKI